MYGARSRRGGNEKWRAVQRRMGNDRGWGLVRRKLPAFACAVPSHSRLALLTRPFICCCLPSPLQSATPKAVKCLSPRQS